jgi:hypothetical protein
LYADLEQDLGFLDHDMDIISYHNGGYDILNNDIMILQDQVTPLYSKSVELNAFREASYAIEEEAKIENVVKIIADEKSQLKPSGKKYFSAE